MAIETIKDALGKSNFARRTAIWVMEAGMFILAGVAAFLLRFDLSLPVVARRSLLYALPIWVLVKLAVFWAARLDRGMWRYLSITDVFYIATANVIGSVVSGILIVVIAPHGFPRSIYLIDLVMSFLNTCFLRLLFRLVFGGSTRLQHGNETERAALIYGAGDAGMSLLREIRNNPRLCYRVLGFVDDRREKRGLSLGGIRVLGGGDELHAIVARYQIDIVLIAIPSATGSEMTRMLELCHRAGVECKTVPGLEEIIEGRGLVGQMRDVAVEDLLGRYPVLLDDTKIYETVEGKVVLVTGAAGSIGSEICRQVARFRPSAIVAFEIAESPLFEIDREMRAMHQKIPFYPEIGSIQNPLRLREVLTQYRPSVVYHAAAYKHVPLMEAHVFEAIENNVLGTYNAALAAAECGVNTFVLISSDKAVRPTNVMGATKRVAELLLSTFRNGQTKYIAVRFGNVLGSNGSVIPIFKNQISSGGPVTVTHPEMRRFFMTIPEACQLVLQASAIAADGQICVLDMGQPVKIVDLARKLILLSGLKPGEDIKIEFTGMRPGEKLCEELSSMLEDTVATEHEKVRIFVGPETPVEMIESWLASLQEACARRDVAGLVMVLKEMVVDYNPSTHLLKRVLQDPERQRAGATV